MANRLDFQMPTAKRKFNAKHIGEKALSVLTFACALGITSPASAETTILPAGTACAFTLQVDREGSQPVFREFRDKNGNVVRSLTAGKGISNTFTNVDNPNPSHTLTTSGGSVSRTTTLPDGSLMTVATGWNVLILFPSDFPAGPSTTLYIGRLVYTVDPSSGVFTVIGSSGKQTDICATLAAKLP
jgi:hypothetical protein